jgi:ribosomal protein S12 methylthiotransferase accessory factor
MTTVGIAGEGPAAAAVRAALGDTDATVDTVGADDLATVDLAVVVGPVNDGRFERANAAARDAGTPWLAVELGGIGGHTLPDVDAAVGGFGPGTACYDCLRTRVAAGLDPGTGGAGTADTPPSTARFAGALGGRSAADLAAGRESPALGQVVELPHAERYPLAVPGCECEAAPPERALDRSHESRSVDAAVERMERALDRRLGPVAELSEAESFPAPYYLASLADTSGFSDARTGGLAAGVAPDWNPAFAKALGEALERYAAAVYRTARFEQGPADAPDAVPPAAFVRPDPDSGGWTEPTADEPIQWVAGESLASGERAWLPAEFVVFPPPEQRYRPAITTGLGLGNSGVEALLSGLYEVIERDAAMLAWYSTFEPLGLAVEADGAFGDLRRRARSEGLSVTTLLLTQDVDVPVVGCAVHREGGEWPRFATGMAADLDPTAAATGALAEALQNWMELRGMGRADATDEPGAIGRYGDLPRAVESFVDPETTVPVGSVGPENPPTGAAALDAVLDRVRDADMTPYAARLTTRDLAGLGFEAVRVLVPTAQPLFTDDPYFGERARTVPGDLGFEPRLDRAHHPFP